MKKILTQCRTCKRVIVYNMYGIYILKNHLETYHEKKSSIYEKAVNMEKGRDILNKYFIMGSEATCPKCELKIDWTDLKHTEERLIKLLRHYFSHNSWIPEKDQLEEEANIQKQLLQSEEIRISIQELIENFMKNLRNENAQKEEKYNLNESGPSTSTGSTRDGRTERNKAKYDNIFRQRELNRTKRTAFWTKHSYPNEIKTVMQTKREFQL